MQTIYLSRDNFRFPEISVYSFEGAEFTVTDRITGYGSGKKTVYTVEYNGVTYDKKDITFYKRLFGVDWGGAHHTVKMEPKQAPKQEPEPKQEPKATPAKKDEIRHSEFEYIKNVVSLKICPYLYGPAGSGKNVICQQLADDLGLQFYYSNSVTQEFKITGYSDANGVFHETEFYKACTRGGLFMIDELDASIPEVLTLMNAALANGYFVFGNNERVNLHPDFRCIAAGNTCGLGANDQYTGRYTIDAATLNRFFVIRVNYDTRVEEMISAGRADVLDFVRNLRIAAKKTAVNMVLGYRNIINLTKLTPLYESGISTLENIVYGGVAAGLDSDTILNLCSNYPGDWSNKYFKAFRALPDQILSF